jgi:hypothetical protein
MRDVVLAVVVSVVISALVTFWMIRQVRNDLTIMSNVDSTQSMALRELDQRRPPTIIAVQVSPSGGTCVADADTIRRSYGAGDVHWVVRWVGNNVNKLCRDGHTVLIRPKAGNVSPLTPPEPFHQHLVQASHPNKSHRYHYEVWMGSSNGSPLFLMQDPELEIIEVRGVTVQ